MRNKKFWLFWAGAALLALFIKYSNLVFYAIHLFFSILAPILLGCVIAYVLNILVAKIESFPFLQKSSPLYKGRRAISILGSLAIIIVIVVLLIRIIIPQLQEAFGIFMVKIPALLNLLEDWFDTANLPNSQIEEWIRTLNLSWPEFIEKASSYLTSGVDSVFSSALTLLTSISGAVVQSVIGFVFALYLLAGKERLTRQCQALAHTYLKEKPRNRLFYVLTTAHETFTQFFVGQLKEAIILGMLCTVGMCIFRFPYASMIGTLVGATALVPIVGAYLGAAIGAFMIFTVNPLQALTFLIFIVILQQLEGNLIYPRVVGSSIGLPSIWVLAAVILGGGLGGIVGMLLAVPTFATVYKLLKKDVHKKQAAAAPEPAASASATDPAAQELPPQHP